MSNQSAHWYDKYRQVTSPVFQDFLQYESQAAQLFYFEPISMLGLLQTQEYAATIFERSLSYRVHSKAFRQKVGLRMERQWRMFEREPRANIQIVLDESVLRRTFGKPQMMYDQLRSLLVIAKQPGITLQVLPMASQFGPIASEAFFMITSPTGHTRLFAENLIEMRQIQNEQSSIGSYLRLRENFQGEALNPAESCILIQQICESFV